MKGGTPLAIVEDAIIRVVPQEGEQVFECGQVLLEKDQQLNAEKDGPYWSLRFYTYELPGEPNPQARSQNMFPIYLGGYCRRSQLENPEVLTASVDIRRKRFQVTGEWRSGVFMVNGIAMTEISQTPTSAPAPTPTTLPATPAASAPNAARR
jgi:hypothetical protein